MWLHQLCNTDGITKVASGLLHQLSHQEIGMELRKEEKHLFIGLILWFQPLENDFTRLTFYARLAFQSRY
jgi:hypothetical protein